MKYKKNAFIIIALIVLGGAMYFSTNREATPPVRKDVSILCGGDPICTKYFEIWKQEQLSRNGYDESYYEKHVFPISAKIDKWNSGESLYVLYVVKIDWALIKTSDHIFIRSKPNELAFQKLNIPEDTYIDHDAVKIVIDKGLYYTELTLFEPVEHLFFKTKRAALNAISAQADNMRFEFDPSRDLTYRTDGPITSKSIFYPELQAYNKSNCGENKLKYAKVNLISGKIYVGTTACQLFGA